MRILKNKNYVLLLCGNAVSRLGNVVYSVIISWWITEQTGNALGIGYILAASALGNIIMSPLGGVLADHVKRKHVIVATDIISGAIVIYMSILVRLNVVNIVPYVIGSFLLGVSSAAFKPAIKAIMPLICSEEELVKCNSLVNNLGEVSNIVGPSIGGFFLLISNGKGAFFALLFDGITFLLSAFSEVLIKCEEKIEKKDKVHFVQEFIEGCAVVKKENFILLSIIIVSLINICLASFEVLLPLYVLDNLKASEAIYSGMLTVYAIGAIIVSLVIIAKKSSKISFRNMCFSVTAIGVMMIVFGINKTIIIASICVFGFGFCEAYFSTTFFTNLQLSISREYLGRVFSLVFTVSMLLTPIANLVYGHIKKEYVGGCFAVCGVLIVILSFAYYIFGRGLSSTTEYTEPHV